MVLACDPFHEDAVPVDNLVTINPTQTEYYLPIETTAESSVIISLRTLVTTSFETISIRVTEYPEYGRVSSIDNFFLKFTPSPSSYVDADQNGERKDQFGISFFRDGKKIITQTISVRMEKFPCSLYAVEDRMATEPGVPVSRIVTFNDHLCDINIDNVESSIALEPRHGYAEMERLTVTYTPETSYEGSDEFIYELVASQQENLFSEGPLVSYGLVTVNIGE